MPVDEELMQAALPGLYDWIQVQYRAWPSLAVCWSASGSSPAVLIFSEQTDGRVLNTLISANVLLPPPRTTRIEEVEAAWNARTTPGHLGRFIKRTKTLIHGGEVNRIRECGSLIATHTDSPDVLVWDLAKQPERRLDTPRNADPSVPDLTLTGHADEAPFALATAPAEHRVASGGRDAAVLVWCLADAQGAATLAPCVAPLLSGGHTKDVEDVAFNPSNSCLLASVGDDSKLLIWDTRESSGRPVSAAPAGAHGGEDIHTCDWSATAAEHIATGDGKGCVRVFDTRSLASAAPLFSAPPDAHAGEAVSTVGWSPTARGAFASAAADGCVCVWSPFAASLDNHNTNGSGADDPLLLRHVGHGDTPVVDLHWHPSEPWVIVSTDEVGGLQAWRVSDLLTRPEGEVIAELEARRAAAGAKQE